MSDASSIMEVASLEAFFHEELGLAFEKTGVRASEETTAYLVHLLDGYATIGPHDTNVIGFDTPAAMLLEQAMLSEGDRRIEIYRRLGDASLYSIGFFEESLKKRTVGPEYYRNLGLTAYSSLTDMMTFKQPGGVFELIYRELGHKFDVIVAAFRWLARRTSDPLEQMLRYGDVSSEELLKAGILASKSKGYA